ncbi:MAG: M3 family metallopeptidase [Burkholderiales bacterium]
MTNPLLETLHPESDLPRFDAIQPDHVRPAMETLLAAAESALAQVTAPGFPADYDQLSATLDVATERLGRAWGAVSHLSAVADTPELRAAYNESLPLITEFHTRLGSDERLYAQYKAVMSEQGSRLSPARRQALNNALRNFRLGGAELKGDAKKRFAEIQEKQAGLAQKFSEHVLDATDKFADYALESELDGVPPDVQEAARIAAQADGREGYKITLHFPSYFPVIQYSHHRGLRQRLYTAHVTRASDLGPPELDNSALMQEILRLRQEEARLLGLADFAEVSLVPKMADSPAQVIEFLRDLAHRARPFAERDLTELKTFAEAFLGLPELQAWDVAYASEKLKEHRYAFSEQAVKAYFTEPRVLQGLFHIIETLFEVAIVPDTAPVWHPSVRFFRIERRNDAQRPCTVGYFYLDPYARPGKRPGAWMDDVRGRWARPEGGLQTPVAHLVCNFAPPVNDKPALLTHDDVTTLFHEFGHGLHHLLTQVSDPGVAGISGVEWDAVELPSQFMENFCWEWNVIKHLTSHVDTGQPIPRELFEKMRAAKNFQSGLHTLRQVEYALFDMQIHAQVDSPRRIADILQSVRDEVAVLKPPAFHRFQHSFSHIFAGGYAAGYYSYKWAEVLSADAWSAFEESPSPSAPLDVLTGRRYRQNILEVGGSRSAMESFKAFRGREPQIDALLRHQGMIDDTP